VEWGRNKGKKKAERGERGGGADHFIFDIKLRIEALGNV